MRSTEPISYKQLTSALAQVVAQAMSEPQMVSRDTHKIGMAATLASVATLHATLELEDVPLTQWMLDCGAPLEFASALEGENDMH